MEKPKNEKERVEQELSKRIQALAPQVPQAMRMKWCLENFKGLSTVNKYFSGEQLANKITGEKLLHDMEQAIELSKQELAA